MGLLPTNKQDKAIMPLFAKIILSNDLDFKNSSQWIVKIETFGAITQKELLRYLLAAEVNSNHPMAGPIVEYAKNQKLKDWEKHFKKMQGIPMK